MVAGAWRFEQLLGLRVLEGTEDTDVILPKGSRAISGDRDRGILRQLRDDEQQG